MKPYEGYAKGNIVEVVDGEDVLVTGTIVRTGSNHAAVVMESGESYDVPYDLLRLAGHTHRAAKEIIREEEHEGRKFVLVKEESNKDGQLAVQFKVLLDDKPISESEELITNVYDQENGWSAPDDFDENKLDLIKSTYESGFDLLVDSYSNIEQSITNTQREQAEAEAETPAEPQGEPAFAPGAEPVEEPPMGGGAGAPAGGSEVPEEAPAEPEGAAAGGPEAQAAPAGEAPAGEPTAASLDRPTFARSVLSSTELLRNPQHRINPVLREEMARRGIDSSATNDLELADELKDFDFGAPAPKN